LFTDSIVEAYKSPAYFPERDREKQTDKSPAYFPERDRETNRQTDRERETDRQTDRQRERTDVLSLLCNVTKSKCD